MSLTKKPKRSAAVGVACALFAGGLLGSVDCLAQSAGGEAGVPTRIGSISDETGALAPVGTGLTRGIMTIQELWNAQPGKRKVEITTCDSQSTGAGALNCYLRLRGSVDAFTGPHVFLGLASVRGVADKGSLAIVSAAPMSAPAPGDGADKSQLFQTIPTIADGVDAGLAYLVKQGLTRIAVLASNDVAGQLTTKAAQELAGPMGVTLVRVEAFDPLTPSLAPQSENIAAAKPQAVLATVVGPQLITGLRALKTAGVEVPIMLNYASMTTTLLDKSGPAAGSNLFFYATRSFDPASIKDAAYRKRVEEFEAAFHRRYNQRPDFLAYAAADTVLLIGSAGAEKDGPKGIRKTLTSGTEFSGVLWDRLRFSPSNHIGRTGRAAFDILQWQPDKKAWILAP